ncbi:hypothetical protein FQA39_LY10931 [Lamprigera yunnana]|nr:hypothetical protein FQA39_LY10931 [Lamprigera yunnana]
MKSVFNFNDVSFDSSLKEFQPVFSYVLRFINNTGKLSDKRDLEYLAAKELKSTQCKVVNICQLNDFQEDLLELRKRRKVNNSSRLTTKEKRSYLAKLDEEFDSTKNNYVSDSDDEK